MTDSEAIKHLENHIEYLKHNWKPNPDYKVLESVARAIKSLEKQIPKKPIVTDKFTSDGVTEIEYRCSICGTNYIELAPCQEWCSYCGNKFDWSDEE